MFTGKAKDIKRIICLDTETDGLTAEAKALEIAVCLFDIEHCAPIASFASLLPADSNVAEHINHITVGLLQSIRPLESSHTWDYVIRLAEMADVIVAHRAEFDIQFVPAKLQKMRPWSCTKYFCDWPKGRPQRGDDLVHLALAHGVPVYSAHRAMADVDTLVRCFQAAQAMGHDISEMIARSLRPRALFEALVSFAEKDKAKDAGFQWTAGDKTWTKTMFLDEAAKLPFKVKKMA